MKGATSPRVPLYICICNKNIYLITFILNKKVKYQITLFHNSLIFLILKLKNIKK